ncbi:MAG: efflux RND transporter periplasmic adaptor subunit [Pseudomonadota bacterium]
MPTRKVLVTLMLSLPLFIACGSKDPVSANASPTQAHDTAKHAEEHGGQVKGQVALSAEAAKAADIAIATVAGASISEVLPLYGTVQANGERVAEVTARFTGVIRSVNARVGDTVREGQVLATVESDESLRSYPVTATLAGVITTRKASPGEKTGETPLFTVADLSSVWVELSLFPRDLAKVRVGQAVRIRSVDGDQAADGKVVLVASLGQSTSQTLAARVLLDNKGRQWIPGLYVAGDVKLSERQVPIAVRGTALQLVEGRSSVFVVTPTGFEVRPVDLGLADGEFTEVRSGLAAGERYAATNSFVLKSELGKGEAEHED